MSGERPELPARDRRQGRDDRRASAGGDAPRQGARARRRPPGRRRPRAAGDRRRRGRLGRLVALALGGSCRDLPARGELLSGPWRRHCSPRRCSASRRRRTRPRSMPPPSRSTSSASTSSSCCASTQEQPISSQGHLEPARVPAARGVRLRGLAVQLHRDRGEPDELAGDDGQHGRLEAGGHGDALGVLPDAALPGGRAARRRDQPRLRQRRDDRRRGALEPAPRGHPLHRLDSGVQRDVAHRRRRTWSATATTRASSARPAARTSSSRTRAPNVEALATAIVRGSFEYQGQKCSASSRIYAPSNLWPELRERLQEEVATIKVGDVTDFRNFMGAVIDDASFKTQAAAIEDAKSTCRDGDRRRRRLRRLAGLLRRADGDRDARPRLQADARGDLRPVVTTYVYDENRLGRHAAAGRPHRRRTG